MKSREARFAMNSLRQTDPRLIMKPQRQTGDVADVWHAGIQPPKGPPLHYSV